MMSLRKVVLCLMFLVTASAFSQNLIPLHPDFSGRDTTLNVLMIPVEFTDWRHNNPISKDNPYYEPIDTTEIKERYKKYLAGYYNLNSRGRVTIKVNLFPKWLTMPKTVASGSYGGPFNSAGLLEDGVNAYNKVYSTIPGWYASGSSNYQLSVIVFAGPCEADEWPHEWANTKWAGITFPYPIRQGGRVSTCAYAGVGIIAHELGHGLFSLKDKNPSSKVPNYRYELMGAGAWNGVDARKPNAYLASDREKNTIPALMTPWERVNLGFERQPIALAAGTSTSKLTLAAACNLERVNDNTIRNLIAVKAAPSVGENNTFYLIENRSWSYNNDLGVEYDGRFYMPNWKSWDVAMPSEGLVIWKITDSYRATYGMDDEYSYTSSSFTLWQEVIDTKPLTKALPTDPKYKYLYLDGFRKGTTPDSSRTSAFNEKYTYSITGKYDAPLKKGESFTLPGTSVVLTYNNINDYGDIQLEIKNIDKTIEDPFALAIINNGDISEKGFALNQNYPNPFNPITTISYSIANAGDVKVVVYNSRGELVKTLVNEKKASGNYSVTFDGSALESGIYFYQIKANNLSETKKMVLVK